MGRGTKTRPLFFFAIPRQRDEPDTSATTPTEKYKQITDERNDNRPHPAPHPGTSGRGDKAYRDYNRHRADDTGKQAKGREQHEKTPPDGATSHIRRTTDDE